MTDIDEKYYNCKLQLQESLEDGFITIKEYQKQLQQIEKEEQKYFQSK